MEVTAVIPIRKGSERVKDKCIRPFGNTNLLQYKIDVLKQVKEISKIVVNTDSEIAIEIAKKNNIDFHIREPYYASSNCPANDYFEYLGKTTDSEIIAYTPVTAPFIAIDTYKRCIEMFDKKEDGSSVITAKLIKDFLWKGNEPLNFSLEKHPRSQDFNDIFAINFGVCLLSRETLLKTRTILGSKPKICQITEFEGIDIDTPEDFLIAEQIFNILQNDRHL